MNRESGSFYFMIISKRSWSSNIGSTSISSIGSSITGAIKNSYNASARFGTRLHVEVLGAYQKDSWIEQDVSIPELVGCYFRGGFIRYDGNAFDSITGYVTSTPTVYHVVMHTRINFTNSNFYLYPVYER